MSEQLALFNLNSVESVRPVHDPYSKIELVRSKPVHDPYWDETEETATAIVEQSLSIEDIDSPITASAPTHASVRGQIFSTDLPDTQYSSVRGQVSTDTKKTASEHETQTTHWVEKYWVARANKKYWYYRYMWMEGRKKHRLHIGSVSSSSVRNKVELIKNAIAFGQSPPEVKELLAKLKS